MIKYIKLYIEFFKQNLKTMLEYKTDFVIGVFSTLITQFYGIFFVWVIFENIKQIHGWTFYEITFVYGLLTLAKGIDMFFFDNLHALGYEYVRGGKFDIFMIRPISPLFQLVASYTQQDGLGLFILGIIVVAKSLAELGITLDFAHIMLLVLFVISGAGIISAINLIFATTGFKTTNSYIVMSSINSFQEFAFYPIAIYPKFIGFILTWIIPFAFTSFYPADFFLHKGEMDLSFLTPVIAVVLWVVALRVWRWGLDNYTSTGS
ncbi:ABC-2 family transporter protein [bacterium]|nr:ABC-2 family transporter protein [bacterium]